MQQTLTAPPVRSALTVPVSRETVPLGALRPSFRDRLKARRDRHAAMARVISAMPASRGIGSGLR